MRRNFILRDDDAGGGDGGGGGETSTPVEHKPPVKDAYTPPDIDMTTAIPPEYRDREYLKGKTFVDVIKDFDGMQKEFGKRPAGIPTPDATTEQQEAFYNKLRPKEAKEYEIPETEYAKKFGRDDKFLDGMRGVFHKAGLSPRQAKILTEGYDAMALEMSSQSPEGTLDKTLTEIYGEDKRQGVLDAAKGLMKENIPEQMKPMLDTLSDDALAVLSATLHNIKTKYIDEDSRGPDGGGGGFDESALRAEAEQIRKSNAYKDFRDAGHDAARARINEIYNQIAGFRKK